MTEKLSCADARMLFSLLLYGELSFDEEERVDTHLDTCAECKTALEREKSLHAAFDGIAVEPAASLLRDCRADLAGAVHFERDAGERNPLPARTNVKAPSGWWDRFVHSLTAGSILGSILRPVGAVALVALGFFGARFTPLLSQGPLFTQSPFTHVTGASQAGIARVSDVETQADGTVRIVVDETRQKTVAGNLDDQQIRTLLLEAVRDPNNSGLRADSAALLSRRAQSAEIRGALVYLVGHDPNDGVRLNAMEGLKSYAADPDVRVALSQALLSDANPGVRRQAIELLIPSSSISKLDGGIVPNLDRATIGTLQELMLRENDASLRQRTQRVLEAINASAEIY
jgi:hypothetical protein